MLVASPEGLAKASRIFVGKCTTQEQWDAWAQAYHPNFHNTDASIPTVYCLECSPAYFDQMQLEGRCIRSPRWRNRLAAEPEPAQQTVKASADVPSWLPYRTGGN